MDADTKPRIDAAAMTAICAIVAADLGTRFAMKVEPQPTDVSFKGEEGYASLNVEQNLGIFASIIKFAEVHVRAAPQTDGTTWLLVDLRYSHHGGGTNGCTIGRYWVKDGAILNFQER